MKRIQEKRKNSRHFGIIRNAANRVDCYSAITEEILKECPVVFFAGDQSLVYLMNKSDIASYTIVSGICTAIVLKADKLAYAYDGLALANNSTAEGVKLAYTTQFDHSWEGLVMTKTQAGKTQLNLLKDSEIVMVVEHKDTGTAGETAFEIFGKDQGLKMESLKRNQLTTDDLGVFRIVLKTPDNFKESALPLAFHLTSYAVTKALLEGYRTP